MRGCRLEVMSFEQSTSNELMRECDQFICIEPNVLFKEEKFVREMQQRRYAEAQQEGNVAGYSGQ